MLDQVRSEFGVDVEVVDASLAGAWTPEGARHPRVLAGSELRALGLGVLREGRPASVRVDGQDYRLVPLRNGRNGADWLAGDAADKRHSGGSCSRCS